MKLDKFMCDVTKALVKEGRVHFLHCGNSNADLGNRENIAPTI